MASLLTYFEPLSRSELELDVQKARSYDAAGVGPKVLGQYFDAETARGGIFYQDSRTIRLFTDAPAAYTKSHTHDTILICQAHLINSYESDTRILPRLEILSNGKTVLVGPRRLPSQYGEDGLIYLQRLYLAHKDLNQARLIQLLIIQYLSKFKAKAG